MKFVEVSLLFDVQLKKSANLQLVKMEERAQK